MMSRLKTDLAHYRKLGVVGIAALIVLVLMLYPMIGAGDVLIADGTIEADTATAKIRHDKGGIITDILVQNGDHVAAGTHLATLDSKAIDAALTQLDARERDLILRRARLEAQRDGSATITLPSELKSGPAADSIKPRLDAETASLAESQKRASTNAAERKRKEAEIQREIDGLDAQLSAKARELDALNRQIEDEHRRLRDDPDTARQIEIRQALPKVRQPSALPALERDRARLEGDIARLETARAQHSAKLAELDAQGAEKADAERLLLMKDLADVQTSLEDLATRRASLTDEKRKLSLTAPVSGRIRNLKLAAPQSLLAAGDVAMEIVPDATRLTVLARVPRSDIERAVAATSIRIRLRTDTQQAPLAARLRELVPESESADPTRLQMVRLDLVEQAPPTSLTPGLPVDVLFETPNTSALARAARRLFGASRDGEKS